MSCARAPGLMMLALALLAGPATADVLPGDLNGDGVIDALDEPYLVAGYGASASAAGSAFEAAGDLDGSGTIDLRDLALFGAAWGASGGYVDEDEPSLFVTLNDLPDDMNDLVVVPPDLFQVTLSLSSAGGSAIDVSSLSVTSDEDLGVYPAGSELADLFTVSPTRAVWEVPAGSDLARTSHYLDVSIADAAGNVASDSYGFAVRDFSSGAPLANLQTIFLDFGQDRSLGPEVDFLEDLRSLGLSTAEQPVLETSVRNTAVALIVARVNEYFGIATDGTPGPNAVNVFFTAEEPSGPHARLCVGGAADSGPLFLGNSVIDPQNISETDDTCAIGAVYGVFPQAIRELWGAGASFQDAFAALDPTSGVPFGHDPLDSLLLGQGFTSEDLKVGATATGRAGDVADAFDAFTQLLASVIAHEVGHLFGLSASGELPAGLYGGDVGTANQDHNVSPGGGVPAENFVMNRGSAFTFDEMTGRGGSPLPAFRPLSDAYLHDRLVLTSAVTGLFPPPQLSAIAPSPAVYPGPFSPLTVTFHGDDFLAGPVPPSVLLLIEGDPTPNPVSGLQWVDAETLTGQISPLLVPPGLYDVEIRNGDGQVLSMADYFEVQAP